MRVCLVVVCWSYGCVLNMVMCVGLVDVCCPCLSVGFVDECWPWSCMLALEMHVGLFYGCGYS